MHIKSMRIHVNTTDPDRMRIRCASRCPCESALKVTWPQYSMPINQWYQKCIIWKVCLHEHHKHLHVNSSVSVQGWSLFRKVCYPCTHTYTYTCTHARTHTHARMHAHTHMHARTHARTHTRTHTHTLNLVWALIFVTCEHVACQREMWNNQILKPLNDHLTSPLLQT